MVAQGPTKPLRPRKLGQLPTAWGAFLRGRSPREKPPLTGEVAAKQSGRALDVSGGGGVKTPPYGAKDKGVVAARLREWVADERGEGGRQPAPSKLAGG